MICKLMHRVIKQICGCLERGVVEGGNEKRFQRNTRKSGYVYSVDCGDGLRYIHICQDYQIVHFICSSLYINFTSTEKLLTRQIQCQGDREQEN